MQKYTAKVIVELEGMQSKDICERAFRNWITNISMTGLVATVLVSPEFKEKESNEG